MKKTKEQEKKGKSSGINGVMKSSFTGSILLIILLSLILSGGVIAFLIRSGAFAGTVHESSSIGNTSSTGNTSNGTTESTGIAPTDEDELFSKNDYLIGSGSEKIRFWSYTTEELDMVKQFVKQNPEFGKKYTIEFTVISGTVGTYQSYLNKALEEGLDAPDIYTTEEDFVLTYSQGDMAKYAAAYSELGIDVDRKVKEADIVKYITEVGSRDGEIVALSYQSTGSAMIYNSDIAKEVFGTDDPDAIEKIIGANTGKWDKFLEAAARLKEKGYAAVSGPGDIWNACWRSADTPWIVDGKISIDPKRAEYLSIAKTLKDNDYTNGSLQWGDTWHSDIMGQGRRKVFAFFGPSWFINYTLMFTSDISKTDGSFGKWRVCAPPQVFFWGGTWIFANKDTKQKEGVAQLIEWITLDTSQDGLQYKLANGLLYSDDDPTKPIHKETVASATVMAVSDGKMDSCGGQNVFPVFIAANQSASFRSKSLYDNLINEYYSRAVDLYAEGKVDRAGAIDAFKKSVKENLGF